MKLQKLAYYAQGLALAEGFSMLNEQPQVWKLWPVFESLYAEMKYHGSGIITSPEPDGVYGDIPRVDPSDERALDVIVRVWDKFSRHTAIQLSDLTHRQGTPWYQIVKAYNGRVPRSEEIPEELMAEWFRAQRNNF